MAGSSFAVGVGFVSRWEAPERQGTVLGLYGLGTIGQSAAVFLGSVLAASMGLPRVFRGTALLLLVWAVVFFLTARDAPGVRCASGFAAMVSLLRREKLAWIGAILGRTINGGARLWGSLTVVVVLVAFHWLIASVSHRWHFFGRLVKGEA